MVKESEVIALNEIINALPNRRQRNYAIQILNKMFEHFNFLELQNIRLKSKRVGVKEEDFITLIEKCTNILKALDFDQLDVFTVDNKATEFIIKHRALIKKPLTKEYFMHLVQLHEYYFRTHDEYPKNLKELANAYTEIEASRQ